MEVPEGDDELPDRVLARHLRERRLPVRYLYVGEAAGRHVQLAEHYPHAYLDGRAEHEVAALTAVLGATGGVAEDGVPRQVCDVGTSNGVHSVQLVTGLARAGFGCDRYLGVDLSARLLRAARARLAPHLPKDSSFARWDFEAAPTEAIEAWRRPGAERVVMCLLGGTLGNTEDPVQALRHLRASCREGDVLALGVFLPPLPDEDVTGPYTTPVMRDMMMIPLRAVGLADHQVDLRVEFTGDAVTGTVRLRSAVSAAGIPLAAGDEIRCFLSRRFGLATVRSLLESAGWSTAGERTDAAGAYAVLIARPS